MREILFRGKRVDDGEWVYGDLLTDGIDYTTAIRVHNANGFGESVLIAVIPETVGQYTGLNDKNGTKIFEGDIVNCFGGEQCQGYWEYDENVIANFDDYIAIMTIAESEYIEVIGNIHGNTELLKGE